MSNFLELGFCMVKNTTIVPIFADCELAWTSFESAVRKFDWRWHGLLQQDMKK